MTEQDQPPRPDDDTTGHRYSTTDDTTDEDTTDEDTEGHVRRVGEDTTDDDAEGHSFRGG
jgi:hypothetical protein